MSVGSDGSIGRALDPSADAGVPEAVPPGGGGLFGSPTLLPASRDTGNILAQTLGAGSGQSFMIDVEYAPQATLLAGAKQLRALVAKLRADLQTYLQVDELPPLKASPGLPL